MRRVGLRSLLAVLAAGCQPEALSLFVDVHTDYAAGVDFASVSTSIVGPRSDGDPDAAPARSVTHGVNAGEGFLTGVRVAEASGLSRGDYRVHVELLDASGAAIATQDVLIPLSESAALNVIITRDCANVVCPRAGDAPEATQCIGGACVDERCSNLEPDRCEARACETSTDCAPPYACATSTCVAGYCSDLPDDSRCAPAERCAPEAGCELRPDLMLDTPVECTAWQGFGYSLCTTAPTDELVVTGDVTYDTDDQEIDDGSGPVPLPGVILPDGGLLLVFSRVAVEEGGRLRVVGRRPLVIASTTRIDVDGEIDASSGRGRGRGAGANDAAHCAEHAARGGAPDPANNSAGGGGGGGYAGAGGDGGRGSDPEGGTSGGRGGGTIAALPPGVFGGCRGGSGGGTNTPGNGGGGGDGGGGIGLVAGRGILVRGVVHAGGAGGGNGNPARSDAGGGGGGSGGLVGLEAPAVILFGSAILAANGGAGGAGSAASGSSEDATPTATAAAGAPDGAGGRGGAGSAGSTLEGEAGNPGGEGGGGGGGGAGLVVVRTPLLDDRGALASPPITGP